MPSTQHPTSRRTFLGALTTAAVAPSGVWAQDGNPGLRAGAAESDITLPVGMPNGGIISQGGPARSIRDELKARALVLDDGSEPLAIVVCDSRMLSRSIVDRAKRLAADALGWPQRSMLVSATHTHAAPGLAEPFADEATTWYAELVSLRIADAIRRAATLLAPAQVAFAAVDKPEHVFNRRWKVSPNSVPVNPFGERTDRVWMNPGRGDYLIEPAGPVDPRFSVVCVQARDGRPLALLGNYGLHYVGGYAGGSVSSDYFGRFARLLAERLGVDRQQPPFVGMLSNGASGDVNNHDLTAPAERLPPWEKIERVAADMADSAAAMFRQAKYRNDVTLASAAVELPLGVRRPDAGRLAWARQVAATIEPGGRLSRSQIYAREALHLEKFPETVSLKLQALRIGDVGIAAAPCEVFAETGLEIGRRSRLPNTFTVELANGYNGYLPTPRQHAWGGYETWPARSSYLEVDASDKIRDTLLDLLAQVASSN